MRVEANLSGLEAALKGVRQLHPIRGTKPDPPSETILKEVRERIKSCEGEKLAELAYSFDSLRIMACLEVLIADKELDVSAKASRVLLMRSRDNVIQAAWFKLILHYPHNLLEEYLRQSLERKGFAPLVGLQNVSERVPSWFLSNRLSEGVLRDYEGSQGYRSLDAYLEGNFIDGKKGVFRETWRLLLSRGSAKNIQKEDPQRVLLEYIKAENAKNLATFCQHYLNALHSSKNWNERILRFIEKKYNAPTDPDGSGNIETPFWQKVKPKPKKDFHAWLMLLRIDEFFEGERADFWRRYVVQNKVSRVKRILEGNGIMIDFGAFGVVEFKSVGNAAYIYPMGAFGALWKKADFERLVGWFKDKSQTVRHRSYPGWDGRIIHSGDWPRETSAKINRLLQK
jgi:hypothetical protein